MTRYNRLRLSHSTLLWCSVRRIWTLQILTCCFWRCFVTVHPDALDDATRPDSTLWQRHANVKRMQLKVALSDKCSSASKTGRRRSSKECLSGREKAIEARPRLPQYVWNCAGTTIYSVAATSYQLFQFSQFFVQQRNVRNNLHQTPEALSSWHGELPGPARWSELSFESSAMEDGVIFRHDMTRHGKNNLF
jgi:hypothetical protein